MYGGATAFVGGDRRPMLLVLHASRLLFIRCDDSECHSINSRVIDDEVHPGSFALLSQQHSLPLIAYTEAVGAPLTIIKCRDATCESSTYERFPDFEYNAWQIVRNDTDLIIFARRHDGSLVQIRCPNMTCAAPLITPVTPQKAHHFAASAAAASAWVFTVTAAQDGVQVFKCAAEGCARAGSDVTVGHGGWGSDLAVSPNARGSAFAALTPRADDGASPALVLVACSDVGCTTSEIVGPSTEDVRYVHVASRPSGSPVLTLTRRDDDHSQVLLCHDPQCSSLAVMELGAGAVYAVSVGDDDLPLIVSAGDPHGVILLTRCTDTACANTVAVAVDLRTTPIRIVAPEAQ